MAPTASTIRDEQALRLAMAVNRLRIALRAARWQVTDLAITQVSILMYLEREGPATASELAVAEHVSPQAVAQHLRLLKDRGYVQSELNLEDRRKATISITPDGALLLNAVRASREAWLARAIEETLDDSDSADLERAIDVLERLAEATTRPDERS